MISSASLEKLPASVTVRRLKCSKISPKQNRIILARNKISSISSTTPLRIFKPASLAPKSQQIKSSAPSYDEVMKLEIEILDKEHDQESKRRRLLIREEPPKKKFIQLEVLTKENEISECDDILDEKHSTISILDVKEISCPLSKDFYDQQINTTSIHSKLQIDKFYEENRMLVRRRDPPDPVLTFEEVNFTENIKLELESQGLEKPTPIQSSLWPCLLKGYDVIAVVGSRSGTKLAYLLPAFVHLNHQEKVQHGEGPIVLIVVATRENVRNIQLTSDSFLKHENLKCLCSTEVALLRDLVLDNYEVGCDVMVATPSEIIEMLNDKIINLSRCSYIVFDEIDKINPRHELEEIFTQSRKDSQIFVRCITLSQDLQTFLDKHLKDYVKVNIF